MVGVFMLRVSQGVSVRKRNVEEVCTFFRAAQGYFSTLEEGGGDGGDGTEGEDIGLFLCTAAGSFHGGSERVF